ncbi:MAG: succinylglutamate desuccinylase/aspartoacylase family protein [Phycisphaerales bacterium]|nr:succinylglutamate desuccinylase/aspartoacylase family protein [Phycisphaerales bacterium]
MSGFDPHNPDRWQRVVGDVVGEVRGEVRGEREGPTLVCVGGVHGNEPAGVLASARVVERLAASPGVLRGRFLALTGNLRALRRGDPALRYQARDLNRAFTDEAIADAQGAPPHARDPEQAEVAELVTELVGLLDGAGFPAGSALLDLHTFSSPGAPFAYVEDSLPARRLGLALGLPLIVGLDEELRGLLADYATNRLGLPSLVVEAGLHEDPGAVAVHESAVWVTLETLGMIGDADALAGFDARALLRGRAGRQAGRFYDIRHREPEGDPPVEMLDRARAFTRVWKGLTPVAVRAHADGRRRVLRAAADGILFMPNRQQRKLPADDAYFILRPIWRRFVGVSGWLRQRAWAHRLLAALPGVRPDPDRPHTLLVDHDVAALMARDILHLFGYRVVRSGPSPYRRWPTRAVMAVWVLGRALLRVGGVLPTGRDEIWVVRRHRLDVEGFPRPENSR